MYADHFGFTSLPFNRAVTPGDAYPGRSFLEAHYGLKGGAEAGYRRMLLTGEPGVGKTTLLRWLQTSLEDDGFTAVRPVLQSTTSMSAGIGCSPDSSGDATAHEFASANVAPGIDNEAAPPPSGLAVIVDDAHLLQEADLVTLLRLSSIPEAMHSRTTLILAGAPVLDEQLKGAERAGIDCSVDLVCRMGPMNADDARAYIRQKLERVGNQNPHLFDHAAIGGIVEFSRGIPKQIDNICGMALLIACDEGRTTVDADMVAEAIEELEGTAREITARGGQGIPGLFASIGRTRTGGSRRVSLRGIAAGIRRVSLTRDLNHLWRSGARWAFSHDDAPAPYPTPPLKVRDFLFSKLGFVSVVSVAFFAAIFALASSTSSEAPNPSVSDSGPSKTVRQAKVEATAAPTEKSGKGLAALVEENRDLQTALTKSLRALRDQDQVIARQRSRIERLHAQVTTVLARVADSEIAPSMESKSNASTTAPANRSAPSVDVPAKVGRALVESAALASVPVTQRVWPQNDPDPMHKVVAGDTLYSIARRFNVSVDQLRLWNGLTGTRLLVGQSIHVAPRMKSQPAPQLLSAVAQRASGVGPAQAIDR